VTTVRHGVVSTVIAVFNRPRLLAEAVASVLAQTYRPIEIVIVNDGSTDETAAVCDAFAAAHPGVVVVIHQANTGFAGATNTGLRTVTGEFVQLLDSDDLLMPEKFAHQVAGLRAHPECGISYCQAREYVLGEPWSGLPARRSGQAYETLFPAVLDGKIWPSPSPLFRRSLIEANGPFVSSAVHPEWEYECRLAAQGVRLHYCPIVLTDMRGTHRMEGRTKGGVSVGQIKDYVHVLDRIAHHARAGTFSDRERDRFARLLFAAARKSAAAGFEGEARRCLVLSLEWARPWRRRRIAGYAALSERCGWQRAGEWFERASRHPVMAMVRAARRQPRAQFDLWRHRAHAARVAVQGQPLAQWPELLRHRWSNRRAKRPVRA
jgi:glycosyltransferase involved in cell wall biosynthesis